MISKNKYVIFLWIINILLQKTYTNPLNNQIILKENKPSNIESMTLDNNTMNNPIKYRTFKVVMVYILAIIGYILPFIVFCATIDDNFKNYYISTFIISTILITIGLLVLIYGWVTKKYIHNLIIQSWKYWILYIITLIIIELLPVDFDMIEKKDSLRNTFLFITFILLMIINIGVFMLQKSPLNNQIILKENNSSNIESTTLDNNTINNPIKYRTFKVVMVYILAIIGYILPFIYWLKVYQYCLFFYLGYHFINYLPAYFKSSLVEINIMFITTIFITIGLMVLIYGWVTKKYIHNLIIQSWKYWILYIITLIIISLLPYVVEQINNKIYERYESNNPNS